MTLEKSSVEEVLSQAMAKRVCVAAVYNRKEVILAPHSLFTRHGEPFLRAVTVEHDGRRPREPKLGTFKLAGLSDVVLTRKLFSAKTAFQGLEPAAPIDTDAIAPAPPSASDG